MSVKTIPRSEFDRLLPQNPALENLMVEQIEWFSNRSGNLIGTIAEGKSVAGWNYAVLKRDKKGDFHVRKVMNDFFSLRAARVDLLISRVDLLLSMAGVEKIDCANRGTANFWLPPIPAELLALNPEC
jgi:hypothetical protein